jgi:hypothetical protein
MKRNNPLKDEINSGAVHSSSILCVNYVMGRGSYFCVINDRDGERGEKYCV